MLKRFEEKVIFLICSSLEVERSPVKTTSVSPQVPPTDKTQPLVPSLQPGLSDPHFPPSHQAISVLFAARESKRGSALVCFVGVSPALTQSPLKIQALLLECLLNHRNVNTSLRQIALFLIAFPSSKKPLLF